MSTSTATGGGRGPQRPGMGPGRGGPFAGMNIPAEKASNFKASARRLLGTLQPERLWLALVLVFAVASVALSVIGPRLLGEGTNLIFAGIVSKQLPAGMSKAQLIAQLRASWSKSICAVASTRPAWARSTHQRFFLRRPGRGGGAPAPSCAP